MSHWRNNKDGSPVFPNLEGVTGSRSGPVPVSKPVSKQYAWKLRRLAAGLCSQCTREFLAPGNRTLGPACIQKQKDAYAKKALKAKRAKGLVATEAQIELGEALLFNRVVAVPIMAERVAKEAEDPFAYLFEQPDKEE